MTLGRHDRPRQRVRGLRVLVQGHQGRASSRSSGPRRTSPPGPAGSTAPGSSGATRSPAPGDDVAGSGSYTHMTLLAETTAGHAQPVPALEPGQPRGLLLQAAHGPRDPRDLPPRAHRDHGLPVGRGADPAPARPVRRGPPGRRGAPGPVRRGQRVLRAHGPRPGHRAAGPRGPAAHRARPRPAARGHQRPALHDPGRRRRARGPAVRAVRLPPRRPQALQVRRRRLLPQVAGRDAAPVPRAARGVRQHPAHRRAVRRQLHRGRGPLHAPLPLPRGRGRDRPGSSRRSSAACTPATPRASRTRSASRPSTRPTSSSPRATRATSSSSPTSSAGPRTTASGSARAAARAPGRCARTRWASPTSTRCSTG